MNTGTLVCVKNILTRLDVLATTAPEHKTYKEVNSRASGQIRCLRFSPLRSGGSKDLDGETRAVQESKT